MDTGEIVTFSNCAEFSRKHNVCTPGVRGVLIGEQRYVGEWFCPDNKWRPKKYEIIGPDKKRYVVWEHLASEFRKDHNLSRCFRDLLSGKCDIYNGWTRADSNLKNPKIT